MENNLGDVVAEALSSVGITSSLVERWLGAPCHCRERQEKLNKLGYWSRRVISGKTENALTFLRGILDSGE